MSFYVVCFLLTVHSNLTKKSNLNEQYLTFSCDHKFYEALVETEGEKSYSFVD